MDFATSVDFYLYQIGGAAQSASHSQAEWNHGSSSHVFLVPLHIMGTLTPSIIALSNTQQVVSLKLTNTNYFYWQMQMKPYLFG